MYVCPLCKSPLFREPKNQEKLMCNSLGCTSNEYSYPIIDKKPLLIPFFNENCIFKIPNKKGFLNLGSKKRNTSNHLRNFKDFIKKAIIGNNKESVDNFENLKNLVNKDSKVLIIGGGTIGSGSLGFFEKCKRESKIFESIDVYYSENITAIADAHYLPYLDKFFNIIIIQAVLEHVINPQKVVSEIYRVLKKDGLIYSETPFLQNIHEGPYDFTRFSHSGHRYLFRNFKEIKSGTIGGAFSSVLFISSYAISGIFRNNTIGLIIRFIFSRFFKILDNLVNNKWNIDVACGTYFLGSKIENVNKNIKSSWIIDYYKGAQKK